MDNENKIKKIVTTSKKDFLKDVFRSLDEKPKVYSLDEEFAKTKKNKNYKLYLFVLAFIAALILNTIIITSYIQYRSHKVTFQISEFEDVNLSELLNSVKKNETRLKTTKQELADIKIELEKKIQKVRKKFTRQREAIYKKDLSSRKEKINIVEIDLKEKKEIKKTRLRYKNKVRSKRKEVNKVQQEINQYDEQLQAATKKVEEMVNNYRRLHKMKMVKQEKELILKYNPFFYSEQLKEIVNTKINLDINKTLFLRRYEPDLAKKKIFYKSDFDKLRDDINSQSLIIKRLRKIPYRNSVAPSLVKLDYLNKSIINDYERLWSALAKKSLLLNNYDYAFSHLAKTQSEGGYIIDPSNPLNILVFINKIHSIKSGDAGLVFRTDDEYIGKIKFFIYEGNIRAKVVTIEEKRELHPFDKILIQIKKE